MIADFHNQLIAGIGSLARDNRTLLRTRCRNKELQMEHYDSLPVDYGSILPGNFNSRSRS